MAKYFVPGLIDHCIDSEHVDENTPHVYLNEKGICGAPRFRAKPLESSEQVSVTFFNVSTRKRVKVCTYKAEDWVCALPLWSRTIQPGENQACLLKRQRAWAKFFIPGVIDLCIGSHYLDVRTGVIFIDESGILDPRKVDPAIVNGAMPDGRDGPQDGKRRRCENGYESDDSDDQFTTFDPEDDPEWDSLFFGVSGRDMTVDPTAGISFTFVESADWWSEGDSISVPGFEGLTSITSLRSAKVIHHAVEDVSWLPGQSEDLYRSMGAVGPAGKTYVAVWLNMGDRSLCSLSEITNVPMLESCVGCDFLTERVKLIVNPVSTKVPLPSKGPKDANTVRDFFGQQGCSNSRTRTAQGIDVVCIQANLHSNRVLKFGLQKVGLKHGNIVEFFLVDWPGQSVISGVKLTVTDSLVHLLS